MSIVISHPQTTWIMKASVHLKMVLYPSGTVWTIWWCSSQNRDSKRERMSECLLSFSTCTVTASLSSLTVHLCPLWQVWFLRKFPTWLSQIRGSLTGLMATTATSSPRVGDASVWFIAISRLQEFVLWHLSFLMGFQDQNQLEKLAVRSFSL